MPQPERTQRPPPPFNPRPHQLPNDLQPHTTNSLMPATTRDLANQWLVLEPIRIEKQYWKDRWSYRELFADLAWRPLLDPNTQLPSEPVAPHL